MQDLINERVHDYYWKHDLNCAITTLKILSELFCVEIHPQVTEAAFGLNAGRVGTQCGLVEGALLSIGIYGSQRQVENSKVQELCRKFSVEFQQKFASVLCKELRPQGFQPANPPHLCENLTQRAVLFTAGFLSRSIVGGAEPIEMHRLSS
ncbi:MAG: GCAxxG family protein [Firmicutes bacterium]|nr:GCAxxG family protein [Bacillota bacterium]